jgi:hypothetical protein
MNKKINWFWDGGASFTSEYQAVLDRATTLGYTHPSDSVKMAQNQLVKDLKDAGIWTLLDILYVPANDVSGNFWKLNWITPASFECTEPAGAVTKSNNGIQGNGTTTYADTNFIPETHATKMTTNGSASQFAYLHTVPSTGFQFCGYRQSPQMHYLSYGGELSFVYRTLNTSAGTQYVDGTPSGSFMYADATTAQYSLWKDGVSVQSSLIVLSLGLGAYNIWLCASNGTGGGYSNAIVSFYGTGAILTGKEMALYTAWNTYKTAIGI